MLRFSIVEWLRQVATYAPGAKCCYFDWLRIYIGKHFMRRYIHSGLGGSGRTTFGFSPVNTLAIRMMLRML